MNRNATIDILKLIMALMIIGQHAGFLGDVSKLGQYLTVNGVFRASVPIFLIINGFYFFSILHNGNQKNWFRRIFILYAIWMAIYSYYWLQLPSLSFANLSRLFQTIIIGYFHLWYIVGMLGAAIILTLMNGFSSRILWLSVAITFFTGIFIQYSGNYHLFQGLVLDKLFNQYWAHRNPLFFSYPFFCIGYLINKHNLHDRISLKTSTALSAIGLISLLGESYINYYQEGRDGGFDNLISLIIASPFILITCLKIKIQMDNRIFSLYSSSIYFSHVLILEFFSKFIPLNDTKLTFVVFLASAIFSFFIIKINNKFKFIL